MFDSVESLSIIGPKSTFISVEEGVGEVAGTMFVLTVKRHCSGDINDGEINARITGELIRLYAGISHVNAYTAQVARPRGGHYDVLVIPKRVVQ